MSRRKQQLPFDSVTLQPKQIIPGGVATQGAPIGIGENARKIASLLSDTSSKLKTLGLTQEQKEQETSRIQAQEEFLKAKRENTLDTLRKATISGQLPEGMSPSYNDYRKVLIAKDAIENGYQNALNANMGTLVDPDISQEVKSKIISDAYAATGIDDLQADPVSKGIILQSLSKTQQRFDALSRKKAVEVNMLKMQDAIDRDTINVLNTYEGDDEHLLDSLNTSIDIAKKASVREPTKQILSTYLKQVNTISREDPDKALDILDAIEDATTNDGAPLIGNVDVAAQLGASRERIENTIFQESIRADRELASQKNDLLKGIESKLTAADMDDPDRIADTFDAFLEAQEALPLAEQVPLKVANAIRKERDALVDQATKVRNGDAFEIFNKMQELNVLSKTYSMQATSASSQQELDTIIQDIQDKDYLTAKDKAQLINDVSIAKAGFEFSSGEYDGDTVLKESGYTPEALEVFKVQFNASASDLEDTVEHIKEFGVHIYNQSFTKNLKQLAEANNLTLEQAMNSNKSYYVSEDKTELPEGTLDPSQREGMMLDKRSNLVKQAADAAQVSVRKYADDTLNKNASLWKAKEMLANDAVTDSLSAVSTHNIRMYKNSAIVEQLAPEAKGIARNTIVLTRGNLARLAAKLKSITKFEEQSGAMDMTSAKTFKEYASINEVSNQYYKMQNMLGYSLKEIINGETLAQLPIDYSKIDPKVTQIVWNEKEMQVMENMTDAQGAELVKKLDVDSFEELIVLQRELMEK